ncbi:class I SAM-dependent methyltransferase [Acinetobacter sp. ANC 4862]|jgi:ubiquinone/menaquinone biosynthesis C-methylase UbiE|uniref:class I SAM-dependent methyltransferase n=1 Tax=Acinetobacter sp. ANC 4862 TaxID=2529849 RepID=UPI00103A9D3E|nr:class I SAM-dependent methyltransferase [Acinetobacter sp. ANC 4862]TCH64833.1 class I SAM-dependent methyltransferase [Acinetobacter sp. ANC 4862]
MTQSLHPAAQKGFSSAAELYQQVRPGYPAEIVSWLQHQLQLGANSQVIDLGSGTGKFLPYLQQITSHIIAIEPVQEMLAQLQQAFPDIQTLQASSEQLPVAAHSVDAVICAQSFHWFSNLETLQQIHQVLKPSGHLALIWNQRDINVDWVKALADLIEPFEGNTPRYHSGKWKNVFEQQSLFQLENVQTFEQQHVGTVENVVSKRLLSTSFIAAMPEQEQQQLKALFEQLVFSYTGKYPQDEITFPYITYAYDFKKID